MSDNGNNVHFSGVRFICSPYLAIKSALASLEPIMERCGPQMNLMTSKFIIILTMVLVEKLQFPTDFSQKFNKHSSTIALPWQH